MFNSKEQGELKRDHKGRPIFIEMPRRMELMEGACNRMWQVLKRLSVEDLKSFGAAGVRTGECRWKGTSTKDQLIEALIFVRILMGEDRFVSEEIESLKR